MVKGQVTGPITLATSVSDADNHSLYSDPALREATVRMLVRNAEWQVTRLRRLASDGVLLLVDEPVLAAYGSSSYLYLTEEDITELTGGVVRAISATGAISGIHVCGNSDWGLILRTGVQVVNFDAYHYGKSMSLYPEDVGAFLDRGGCIAWGIVPTTDAVRGETVDSLAGRLESCFAALAAKGLSPDLLRERALLTPSCGAGNLSCADTRLVFHLLQGLRNRMRGAR